MKRSSDYQDRSEILNNKSQESSEENMASKIPSETLFGLFHVGDARDTGPSPESGRSTGIGNGNPFQCSCLGNSMDRGP